MLRDVALITGGGYLVKLYYVLLDVKRAQVELLQTRVQHLEKMSAPALAEQLERVAPVLNRYAKENEEFKEKQQRMGDTAMKAALYANTVGTGQGMLEVILAFGDVLKQEAMVGPGGVSYDPDVVLEKLDKLSDKLLDEAIEALKGNAPDLPRLKEAAKRAQRASLVPPSSK